MELDILKKAALIFARKDKIVTSIMCQRCVKLSQFLGQDIITK